MDTKTLLQDGDIEKDDEDLILILIIPIIRKLLKMRYAIF